MIIKWLQSVISRTPHESLPTVTPKAKFKKEESGPVDIAHEALKNDAESLSGLLQMGMSEVNRRKFKEKTRKKVKSVIANEFDNLDIIEEVTERITDVAEFDPYYREKFED